MANNHFSVSDFYCTCCGKRGLSLPRPERKQREPGHLKELFCFYCGEEKNAVEIKQNGRYTLEIFKAEFERGNFKDGNRVEPYRQFYGKVKQERNRERARLLLEQEQEYLRKKEMDNNE